MKNPKQPEPSLARRRSRCIVGAIIAAASLAGCDSALLDSPAWRRQPVGPPSIPVPPPNGHVLAHVELRFDPTTGLIRQSITPVAPGRRPTPATEAAAGAAAASAEAEAAPPQNVNAYFRQIGTHCDKCHDGILGIHTITADLQSLGELLAHVKPSNVHCDQYCMVVDPGGGPGLMEVVGPTDVLKVAIVVDVLVQHFFNVSFDLVGEPVTVNLCLKQVSFLGDYVIDLDGDGSISDPIWTDTNCDRLTERNLPIAYPRLGLMDLRAVLAVDIEPSLSTPLSATISASSGYPMKFSASNVSLLDNQTIPVALDPDRRLPNTVEVIDQLQLAWTFTLAKQPAVTRSLGASWHLVYTTLDTPRAPLYLTLLNYSSRRARGLSEESAVAAAIWSEFTDREVRKARLDPLTGRVTPDGPLLTYWHHVTCGPTFCKIDDPPAVVSCGGSGTTATTTGELLHNLDGQCGSWAHHLIDALAIHGIDSEFVPIRAKSREFFLVKDWTFHAPAPGGPCTTAPWSYHLSDLVDELGVAGQGNANPPGGFQNHFLVRYGGKYYDPSYGTGPFATLLAWEQASVAGYGWAVNSECVKADSEDDQEMEEY
jgi:hypothetical protein